MTIILKTTIGALAALMLLVQLGYAHGGSHSSAHGSHAVWNARTGR